MDVRQGVTTRLEDVQKDLRKLLPADAILIGQSFNNDLRALQVTGGRLEGRGLFILSRVSASEYVIHDQQTAASCTVSSNNFCPAENPADLVEDLTYFL